MKQQVEQMARDIGFDAVDAGPLQNARLLEPLGYFDIQLGYVLGLGSDIGLKLVRAQHRERRRQPGSPQLSTRHEPGKHPAGTRRRVPP